MQNRSKMCRRMASLVRVPTISSRRVRAACRSVNTNSSGVSPDVAASCACRRCVRASSNSAMWRAFEMAAVSRRGSSPPSACTIPRRRSSSPSPVNAEIEQRLIEAVLSLLPRADAVVLSDYAKGVLGPRLIRAVIDAANAAGKPVVVDPKRQDFSIYHGATRYSSYIAIGLGALVLAWIARHALRVRRAHATSAT